MKTTTLYEFGADALSKGMDNAIHNPDIGEISVVVSYNKDAKKISINTDYTLRKSSRMVLG